MFFGYFWGDWTLIIVLPGFLFALYAQYKVNSTYRRFSSVMAPSGLTGAAVARRILDANGLHHVPVEVVAGELTDHYNPSTKTLSLSGGVYHGNSMAAIGVAAHEVGHALQDAKGYIPLRARIALVPVCNIGSSLAFPLFFIGLLLAGASAVSEVFLFLGVAAFSLSVLFQLITLPVEFNASRRAIEALSSLGFSGEARRASRRVLTAAALTYVASLAVALLSLLRLLVIAAGANQRRR